MKQLIITLLIVLAFTCAAFAQTYTSLGTDASSDGQFNSIDVKELSYAIDKAKDSLWLKVETHNTLSMPTDFGLMFGLDTNKKATDGEAWPGANKSMKYDIALFIYQNYMFPGYYGVVGKVNKTTDIPVDVKQPDNKTFIIRVKLSALDKDGEFNLLTGSGTFSIASSGLIDDDIPNTGNFAVKAVPSSIEDAEHTNLKVYPNPATDAIYIQTDKNIQGSIIIYDMAGRVVLEKKIENSSATLSVTELSNGMYMYKLLGNAKQILHTSYFTIDK